MEKEELILKNGKILLDGEEIGYIESMSNFLNRIEIKPEYRGKKYGKKALEKWKNKKLLEHDYLETSEIVDSRMEKILEDLEFKRNPKEKKSASFFYQQ